MKTVTIAALAALLAMSVPGMAQTYHSDVRQFRQDNRIERGVHSGKLTPREARRLERQQNRIERTERRARAANGGYVDPRSQRRIERMQDRANSNIARKTHNARRW